MVAALRLPSSPGSDGVNSSRVGAWGALGGHGHGAWNQFGVQKTRGRKGNRAGSAQGWRVGTRPWGPLSSGAGAGSGGPAPHFPSHYLAEPHASWGQQRSSFPGVPRGVIGEGCQAQCQPCAQRPAGAGRRGWPCPQPSAGSQRA